jgi:hypothetical protein
MMTGDCALCGRGTVKVSVEAVTSAPDEAGYTFSWLVVTGACHGNVDRMRTGLGPGTLEEQALRMRLSFFDSFYSDEAMFRRMRHVERVEINPAHLSIIVHMDGGHFVEVSEFAIEQARGRLHRRPPPLSKEQLADGVAKLKASIGRL